MHHLRTLKHRLAALLPSVWDQRCVWAACTLGFYGAMRSGEYLLADARRGARREDVQFTSDGCRVQDFPRNPSGSDSQLRQRPWAYQIMRCKGWVGGKAARTKVMYGGRDEL